MPLAAAWIAAVLPIGPFQGAESARARSDCARSADAPTVDVRLIERAPELDHTRPMRWINRRAKASRGRIVQGLTVMEWERGFEWRHRTAAAAAQDKVCIAPATLNVVLTVTTHKVYIPREFPRRGCEFMAVLEHEQRHVDVNRAVMHELRRALERRLGAEARRQHTAPAVAAPRAQSEYRRRTTRMEDIFNRINATFRRTLDRRQARIDTPKEYERVSRQCGPGSLLHRDFSTGR